MPPAALVPAIIAATVVSAGVSIGTSMYQANEEKKLQKKALDFQEQQVRNAESKVAAADAAAKAAAQETIKKQRTRQTQTILTTPLGIQDEANTQMKSLLGG